MKCGSVAIRCFALVVVLLCLVWRVYGSDGLDGHNACSPGKYWTGQWCQACDQCLGKQFELSPCSATENTVCLTHRQYKLGVKCLSQHRVRHLRKLLNGNQAAMPDRRVLQKHPCTSLDSRILRQLYIKLTPVFRSKAEGKWLKRETRKTQKHRQVKITKRDTSAIDFSTQADSSSSTTTTLVPPGSIDIPVDGDFFRSVEQSKGRKKTSKFPQNRDMKKEGLSNLPTQISGEFNFEKESLDKSMNTRKGSQPTSNPGIMVAGTDFVAPGRESGIFNKNDPPKKTAGNSADSPSSPSSSSSSWFSDHSELLYSLLAAGAVIVVLSVFIITRFNGRVLARKGQTSNKLKIFDNMKRGRGATEGEGEYMEMGVVESGGIVTKEMADSKPRTRKLSTSYESDTETSKNNKFLLSHSQSSNLEMASKSKEEPWHQALKSTASMSRMDWLAKDYDVMTHNDFGSYHSEAETQTDGETLSHNSKTVFGTKWQFSGTFSKDGGVLERENSDVTLVVGKDAVTSGQYVTIHGAIFTDASEIRRKFTLASNEMLITPLVEYHAQDSYHFQQHVSVKLPHALPDDFDTTLIKFYTFSVDDCGNVVLEVLPLKSKDNTSHDETDAFWEISNQGRNFIAKTKHFSGYFCTTCESKSKLPSIYARVFGSHIQIKSSRREVRLILYLWDRRLNIKDFIEAIRQQECDMDRQLLADEPVPLLDNASSDSSIVMRMETLGDPEDQLLWRHVTRSNASRPLFKPLQVRKLRQIVLCCQQSDPMRVEWAMENVSSETFPSNVFQCLIEMVHIPEGISNYEEALQDAEEENIRTFYVRNLKLTQNIQETSEDIQSKQDLLKKAMSHILNMRDMEEICQAFGLNKKDIGNFSRKFESDDALKTGLLEECSKKCGMVNFLQALPHVLRQTQLFHVIKYLQDRDLLSNLSGSMQGSGIMGSSLQQQQQACLRQLSESTVCKSISHPQIELESRQHQADSSCTFSNSMNSSCSMTGGEVGVVQNPLRLQMPAGSSLRNEDGMQVSPDSDYSSPSVIPPRNLINNIYGNELDTRDCNISVPHRPIHNKNNSNSNINDIHDSHPSMLNTSNNTSSSSSYNHTRPNGSCSNSYKSSSDDSDFDDSCLATIDSLDLKDSERMGLDKPSLSDWSEETSRKELAMLGMHQQAEVKGTCVAYPEIPEEQCTSCNGPGAISKKAGCGIGKGCGGGCVSNGCVDGGKQRDNRHNEEIVPPLSNSDLCRDLGDDTFVKETYI